MPSLSEADKKEILELARQAVNEVVHHGRRLPAIPKSNVFEQRCGVFVTLHASRRLRGCIGMVDVREPLGACLVRCAVGAATEDPRFSPIRPEEMAELRIEVSLLTPLERIRPEQIEIGKHGLVVEQGLRRGLLLPQVAVEHHLDPERFLSETCLKAGLEPGAWKDARIAIYGFTCEVVAETS